MAEKEKQLSDENYNRLKRIVTGEKIIDVFKNVPEEDIKDFVIRFDNYGYVNECLACANHSLLSFKDGNYGVSEADLSQSAWAESKFREQGRILLNEIKSNPALLQNYNRKDKSSLKAQLEVQPKYYLTTKEMETVEKKIKELSLKLEQVGKNKPTLLQAYANYWSNIILTERSQEQFYNEKSTFQKNEIVLQNERTKIKGKEDVYRQVYLSFENQAPKQTPQLNKIPLWENVKALFYRKFEPAILSLPDFKDDIKILSEEQKKEVGERIDRRQKTDFSLFDMTKVTKKVMEIYNEVVAGILYTNKVKTQYDEAIAKHKNSFLEKENRYYAKSDSLLQEKDMIYRTLKDEYTKIFGLEDKDFFITQNFVYINGKADQMGNDNVARFEKNLSKVLPLDVRQELVNYQYTRVNQELDNLFADWGNKTNVSKWKDLMESGSLRTLLSNEYKNFFEDENHNNREFFEHTLDKRILSDITKAKSPELAGELVIGLVYDETSKEEIANFLSRNKLSPAFNEMHNRYVFDEKTFLTDHMYDDTGEMWCSKADAEEKLRAQNDLFSEKSLAFVESAKKILKDKADINLELTNQISFKR